MKTIILSLTIAISSFSFSAEFDSKNCFFLLESVCSSSGEERCKLSNYENFLQMNQGLAVFSSLHRENKFGLYGEIRDLKTITDNSGVKKTIFYIYGKELFAGKILNFEISELEDSSFLIHYFNKFGGQERYYKARIAQNHEVKKILAYNN